MHDSITFYADGNGSFNIVRKILLNFSYNKKLINIEYELMEISNYRKIKLFNFYDINQIIKTEIKSKELT